MENKAIEKLNLLSAFVWKYCKEKNIVMIGDNNETVEEVVKTILTALQQPKISADVIEQEDLLDFIYGTCSNCNTKVKDDNAYCYRCGSKLIWENMKEVE